MPQSARRREDEEQQQREQGEQERRESDDLARRARISDNVEMIGGMLRLVADIMRERHSVNISDLNTTTGGWRSLMVAHIHKVRPE